MVYQGRAVRLGRCKRRCGLAKSTKKLKRRRRARGQALRKSTGNVVYRGHKEETWRDSFFYSFCQLEQDLSTCVLFPFAVNTA